MKMIDLKNLYGKRYRVTVEESYAADKYPGKPDEIVWYYEIVGRYGKAYLFSPTTVSVEMTPKMSGKFLRLYPRTIVHRVCSEGSTMLIGENMRDIAIRFICPRRRRHTKMTPERLENLRKYHFRKTGHASQSISNTKTGSNSGETI